MPKARPSAWEGRRCNDYPVEGLGRGALVYGTEGTAVLEGDNYTIFDKKKKVVKEVKEAAEGRPTQRYRQRHRHWALTSCISTTLSSAIRDGQPLNSPIAEGHKSVAMLHLGNIAWRVGR